MRIEKVVLQMNDQEFADALEPILKEYLEHGDTAEVKVRTQLSFTLQSKCSELTFCILDLIHPSKISCITQFLIIYGMAS